MYAFYIIGQLESNAHDAATKPIYGIGISVYVNSNPDDVSPDFIIDPADTEGIKIFREFASKMAEHYITILNKEA